MSDAQHNRPLDVAVVGGGIVGLSIAWRAASLGLRVVVLERGDLGGGASRLAAGMLAPVSEAEYGRAGARGLELGLAGAERWPRFAAELEEASGEQVGLRATGALIVARDRDEAEALERQLRFRQSLGLRALRLRASEAREREPALAPTIRLALEAPDDHSVDPRRTTAALAVAAGHAGVDLRPGAPVGALTLAPRGERVSGVQLESGEALAAERVVVATGAWTGLLGGIPASARVPVRPVKGQILRLRDPAGPGLLGRIVRYEGGYLVPRGDGRYVLGGTVEEQGFDTAVTAGGVLDLLREAHELLPGVSELVLEELGAGLRPGSPDNVPAVGSGAVDGLIWATGHYRNGILLAPLTAELVCAELTGAERSELAAACSPERLLPYVSAPA